jgi:hypothetical protein
MFPEDDIGGVLGDHASWWKRLQEAVADAQVNMAHSQQRSKAQYDKSRASADVFQKGDTVMLSAAGISWPVEMQQPPCFMPTFIGPLRVLSGPDRGLNYTIELPPEMRRVHNVFHVEKLRRYLDPKLHFKDRKGVSRPPPIITEKGEEFELEAALDVRVKGTATKPRVEFLIQWAGYGQEEASWEPYDKGDKTWTQSDISMLREYAPALMSALEERAVDKSEICELAPDGSRARRKIKRPSRGLQSTLSRGSVRARLITIVRDKVASTIASIRNKVTGVRAHKSLPKTLDVTG